jgi:2',3'-cyclic-nucleotide 2'-phosphodiesterase (5'-nucleotidase family)
MPNDLRLAKEVEEIDLILGGHDHISQFIEVNSAFWRQLLVQL